MVVNFVIVQAAPGGPVEQMIARLKGENVSATERVSGGTGEIKMMHDGRGQPSLSRRARPRPGADQAARKAIRLRQAAPDALCADDAQLPDLRFRHQLFSRPARRRFDQSEIAGVDFDRAVDDPDHLSGFDPARHQESGARRQPVRCVDERGDHHRQRGAGLSVCRVVDRAVRRRQLSVDLSVARAGQRQLGLAVLADAHRRLFLAHQLCRSPPW